MYPFLVRLGIPVSVQDFFRPYMKTDGHGNLLFTYQDSLEDFGMAYHLTPASDFFWSAGEALFSKELIITGSAMEAIAYLTVNHHRYRTTDTLLFLATGNRINSRQLDWIRQSGLAKSCTLTFEKSLLGNVADLKMAAGIQKIPVAVFAESGNRIRVRFRLQDYQFDAGDFTLSRFEKASGFRFGIRTSKSKSANTFLDQLKAGPFIPNL